MRKRYKELYLEEVERLCANGMDYDQAGRVAYENAAERLYERADMERKRLREEPPREPK